MRDWLRRLLVVGVVVGLCGPATAGPDPDGDAVEALLAPGASGKRAEPEDARLDLLLADETRDPWILAEHLLARDRQGVALRLARKTDERLVGPLTAYVEAHVVTEGVAARARELLAALVAEKAGNVDAALGHLDRVRAVPGGAGVFGARAAGLRGDLLARSSGSVESIEAWLDGGEEALRNGWWKGSYELFQRAHASAGGAHAYDLLQRATEGIRSLTELYGTGAMLAVEEQNLGAICGARGDLPGALRHFAEALRLYDDAGLFDEAADVRSRRTRIYAEVGRFEDAMSDQRSLATYFADRPHDAAWAENQIRLGDVRGRLGDGQGASDAYQRALDASRVLGSRELEGHAQAELGFARALLGRWSEAIAASRAARVLLSKAGDAVAAAAAESNLASFLRKGAAADAEDAAGIADAAEREAALERSRAALAEARALIDGVLPVARKARASGVLCEANHELGQILLAEGRAADALPIVVAARKEAIRLRAWNLEVATTVTLARARLALGDWAGALEEARLASGKLADAFGGLPDADLARARSLTPDVYDIGITAALRSANGTDLSHLDDLAFFLEAGRAVAMLRGLGGRATAGRATVPKALELRLAEAARARVDAFSKMQRARGEEFAVFRALKKQHDERRADEKKIEEEVDQIQSAATERLAPASPVTIDGLRAELRATKRPGVRQVFVLFNFQGTEGVALLVEESGARTVTYAGDDLVRLLAAFDSLSAARGGDLDAGALDVIRTSLIAPLKIPAGPTRLLVCPDRGLAYVPLSAVVPDDWEIAWEPSATTFALFAERGLRKGRFVLGLGDPDYRASSDLGALAAHGGPPLVALPATRAEIASLTGRPGDVPLLGPKATERDLREALEAAPSDQPWKSIHLACHGLVDVEWPARSCLALTPGGGGDGLLTATEVLTLPLRTDLTVLSACQTGIGTFVRGEGLMSLARAFMFAGSLRVIASMWNVDDEATAYLMKEFYREWDAGAGTARALRLAQRAVRDHAVKRTVEEAGKPARIETTTPWAAPKYWAAWVLWGLPD